VEQGSAGREGRCRRRRARNPMAEPFLVLQSPSTLPSSFNRRIAPFLNWLSRLPSWRVSRLRKGAKLRWPEAQQQTRGSEVDAAEARHRRCGSEGAAPGTYTAGWTVDVSWRVRGASRLDPPCHFRLVAVLVEALICNSNSSKSLTCGLSVIELLNTRGYLEKPYPNRQYLPIRPHGPPWSLAAPTAPHACPETPPYAHCCIGIQRPLQKLLRIYHKQA
jgi:hypothetical protein